MKTKNLTLSEALATGLPFRRQDRHYEWIEPVQAIGRSVVISDVTQPIWEVKREPREWTLYYSTMFGEWKLKPDNVSLVDAVEQIKVREVIE